MSFGKKLNHINRPREIIFRTNVKLLRFIRENNYVPAGANEFIASWFGQGCLTSKV